MSKETALKAASEALSDAAEEFSDEEFADDTAENEDAPYRRLSYMRDEVDELATEFAGM